MKQRRTTVMVDDDALASLGFEAKRRSLPLAELLREAIDEKVESLRAARRPRVGVARSSDGQSAADLTGDPIAHDPR
jgi:hypothetical protein